MTQKKLIRGVITYELCGEWKKYTATFHADISDRKELIKTRNELVYGAESIRDWRLMNTREISLFTPESEVPIWHEGGEDGDIFEVRWIRPNGAYVFQTNRVVEELQ